MESKGSATVVKHTGSHYMLSKLPKWDIFPAVIRGKLRLKDSDSTNPIAVGDIVDYTYDPENQIAVINKVHPRKNYIIRKSTNLSRQSHIIASNIDIAYLIVTIDFPQTRFAFIDRFLVTCEAYKIPVKIILNKIDLFRDCPDTVNSFKEIYLKAGYEICELSTIDGTGIEILREEIKDKVVLFSGVSGVGKSSILKALDPNLSPKIGEISEHFLQGKHTTTFYEMHPIISGGFAIDTPGIRGFGLIDLDLNLVSTYFPEMLRVMDECKFQPCTHTHEPHCAVKRAIEEGEIAWERYNSYLGMIEEETKYR